MRTPIIVCCGFLGLSTFTGTPVLAQEQKTAVAQKAPELAQKVVDQALKRAKAADKKVLVVYHASWCGWCKRLDAKLLNDPAMGKLLAAHYEIVHLDVAESPDKKILENPDGNELMDKMGGKDAGLPFYAVLDASGKKIADSNRMPKNMNIGYPGAPEEITAFVQLLKETAPRMTEAERNQVADHLTKNAPKQ